MHHASIGFARHAFGQDRLHILIRVAGVDDQGQAGFLCCLDMDAQAGLLDRFRVRAIVVIEPGFANAHELWMLGKGE